MPEAKVNLKNLYRIEPIKSSRMEYLRLDMNEGVCGLPESFIKRTLKEIDPGLLSAYPQEYALLRKIAIRDKLKPENICLANGSVAAIKYIFDAYISKADRVLITDPTFAMYPVYAAMFAADSVAVQYKPNSSFPYEYFMKNLTRNIKLAVIVNPNNPTGSIVEKDDLEKIIKKAVDNDILLIIDEAYFLFYPHTAIDLVKKYKNLIVLRTFSKLCSMAALRLGYAAACPEVIRDLNKVKTPHDVNSVAMIFAGKLLDNPKIIHNLIKKTNEGREYLINRLSEEGIEYKGGQANFILINCNNNIGQIMGLLKDKKILVAGGFLQDPLKDYIRVTYGDRATMNKFWDSFIKIWKVRKIRV